MVKKAGACTDRKLTDTASVLQWYRFSPGSLLELLLSPCLATSANARLVLSGLAGVAGALPTRLIELERNYWHSIALPLTTCW